MIETIMMGILLQRTGQGVGNPADRFAAAKILMSAGQGKSFNAAVSHI
jgi:hypothetical protein